MSTLSRLDLAREELFLATQERIALDAELNGVRYASDLMADELVRRTPASDIGDVTRQSDRSYRSSRPKAIEATLLEAKGQASNARLRVEQLQTKLQNLRTRPASSPTRKHASVPPLSPGLHLPTTLLSQRSPRKSSSRTIADFDAFIAFGEGELLPCCVSVSAGCFISIHSVSDLSNNAVRREPVLTLTPPYLHVPELVRPLIQENPSETALSSKMLPWMATMSVQAQRLPKQINVGEESRGISQSMTLCGLYNAVADACALIQGHERNDVFPSVKASSHSAPPILDAAGSVEMTLKASQWNSFSEYGDKEPDSTDKIQEFCSGIAGSYSPLLKEDRSPTISGDKKHGHVSEDT